MPTGKQVTAPLSDESRDLLAAIVRRYGVRRVSHDVGVGVETLARACAGLPLRGGSRLALERELAELRPTGRGS